MNLKTDIFAALRETQGLSLAVLTGPDGLPLATLGEGAELLAAELVGLRTAFERTERRLGVGEVSRAAFTTSNLEIVTLCRGDYTLGAALMRGSDTASTQQRLAEIFEEVLALLSAQADA